MGWETAFVDSTVNVQWYETLFELIKPAPHFGYYKHCHLKNISVTHIYECMCNVTLYSAFIELLLSNI